MNNNPIGIFDSGVGGTSIWKEIIQRLPYEDTIYLADSKNAPYGNKPQQEILDICEKNTELLIKKGAKIIVVACNTATTNVIDYLRNKYEIPFLGIEPAIKPAVLMTKTKKIGILATQGTLSSELFNKTTQAFASNITVIKQKGTGLVPLIENNQIESKEMKELLQRLLQPMIQKNIDCLVLGCSHYPYLIPKLKEILGSHVQIIDSGFAVAKQTEKILKVHHLLNLQSLLGKHILLTNHNPETLFNLTREVENTDIVTIV